MQCETLTIAQLHNVQDYTIIENVKYATEFTNAYHLRADCYTVKSLGKQLTAICTLCSFDFVSQVNNYEGKLVVRKNEKIEDLVSLSYQIPNRLAYCLGLISYSDAFRKGLDKTTEVVLLKNGEAFEVTLNVNLIYHMQFLQLTSNFMLHSFKHIAHIYLSPEELIKIYEDKLTISPKNLHYNLTSFNSIGIYIYINSYLHTVYDKKTCTPIL